MPNSSTSLEPEDAEEAIARKWAQQLDLAARTILPDALCMLDKVLTVRARREGAVAIRWAAQLGQASKLTMIAMLPSRGHDSR